MPGGNGNGPIIWRRDCGGGRAGGRGAGAAELYGVVSGAVVGTRAVRSEVERKRVAVE